MIPSVFYPRALLEFRAYYDTVTQALAVGATVDEAEKRGEKAALLIMQKHDEIAAEVAKQPPHFQGLTAEERAKSPCFLSMMPVGGL